MSLAFVFDIDGVLYRLTPGGGKAAIPGARDALEMLRSRGIPHIFVSNGTGSTEAEKAGALSTLFDLDISGDDVVLASTSMKHVAKGKRKLIVAVPDVAHRIAAAYGFDDYITLDDYAAKHPKLHPTKAYSAVPGAPEDEVPIGAVLVFQSPEDWYEGLQILSDVLRSTGVPGAANEATEQVVELHFGNPDFDYAAAHDVPRYTLGAFRTCLETLYRKSTGRELVVNLYGKPFRPTFECARAILARKGAPAPRRVYMVGDNPKSDIQGANGMGDPWRSILVRTGCFQGGDNDPTHPASQVHADVLTAVTAILEEEGAAAAAAAGGAASQ